MLWEAIGQTAENLAGGAAGGLAIAAFLSRRLVEHRLVIALETHKHELNSAFVAQRDELQRAAAIETEKIKGTLAVSAKEHEILFTRLQDRRVAVIDELYGKLVDAIREITSFVNLTQFPGEPTKGEKAKRAADAYNDFIGYFDRKKIWLPPDCCEKLEELRRTMIAAFVQYDTWRSLPDGAPGHAQENQLRAWAAAFKAMTEDDVPPARAALERVMRELLQPTPIR
jgi:hypothetical protein